MLYIEKNGVIKLTRGDTAQLQVPIQVDDTNELYEFNNTDILRFTVKESVNDAEPLFQIEAVGSNSFTIIPSNTKQLSFGKYVYDVELTKSENEVYTVIPPNTFEILKEVG